jgi:hypothetical protein
MSREVIPAVSNSGIIIGDPTAYWEAVKVRSNTQSMPYPAGKVWTSEQRFKGKVRDRALFVRDLFRQHPGGEPDVLNELITSVGL